MRKCFLVLCLFLVGCTLTTTSPQESAEVTPISTTESVDTVTDYPAYTSVVGKENPVDSYTAQIDSHYKMSYSDGSMQQYAMTGTLAAQDMQSSPIAHLYETIQANGLESHFDGYYYNGTLFNTFNNVNYYDPMTYEQLKASVLVPLDSMQVEEQAIQSLRKEEGVNVVFTFQLRNEDAKQLFLQHYDFADLEQYDTFTITNGQIVQTFSKEGIFLEEEATFQGKLTVNTIGVQVDYHSDVEYQYVNQTVVRISDEEKEKHTAYVSYQEIDTDAISDYDPNLDCAVKSVVETFKKRLIGRLRYEDIGNNVYRTAYNNSESYLIDFNNHNFVYANYSSRYVYNWLGDTGSFETTCNYDYATKQATEGCDASVIEMLENVKLYLQMEMYYCGLSLDELVAEEA